MTSLKRQWKRYRKKLRRCQERFSEKAVHDSRVETRRLLSILELLSPFLAEKRVTKARAVLKLHLDASDELRDSQVQSLAVHQMANEFPAARLFQEYLNSKEQRLVRLTRNQVKRIRTKPLGKLIASCREEVKLFQRTADPRQTNALLLGAIRRAFNRAQTLKEQIDSADTATIHRTRVAFKKFRYMIETLASLLPPADASVLSRMRDYQTRMGDIQDIEVLRRGFHKFSRKKRIEPRLARRFEKELHRRCGQLVGIYLDAAEQLRDFQPQRFAVIEPGPLILRRLPGSAKRPAFRLVKVEKTKTKRKNR